MAMKKIDLVVVGADRIAANGDAANKVGTYNVAIIAKEHGIPFYVAAPTSTFDVTIKDGTLIPIEERDAKEVTEGFGRRTVPEGVRVYSPAFDVTPHSYITAIVTERGILRPPFAEAIRRSFKYQAGAPYDSVNRCHCASLDEIRRNKQDRHALFEEVRKNQGHGKGSQERKEQIWRFT